MLNIHFASLLPSRQEGANWGEYWELRWTPEAEIEIVESALMGDTIQGAAAFALKERFAELEARNRRTADTLSALWNDIFDNKSYAYDYLLEALRKEELLKPSQNQRVSRSV